MSSESPDNRSPYCMRCNRKDHGAYEGGFHETNEHDEWLKRVRAEEASGDDRS